MILLFLFAVIYSYYNYKGSLFFTAFVIIFFPFISSGIPGVKFFSVLSIVHIVMYFIGGKYKYKNSNEPYPLCILLPCILSFIGYMFSNYYGYTHGYATSIVNCCTYFLYPYIVWTLVTTKKEVEFILRNFLVFFTIVGFFVIPEAIFHFNIFVELCNRLGIMELSLMEGETRQRFGLARCSSLLSYSSVMGMACASVFYLTILLKVYGCKVCRNLQNILLFLMPLCVLLSGTRSQFVVLFILCISFFFFPVFIKSSLSKKIFICSLVVLLLGWNFFSVILDSIINNDKAQLGSTSELRDIQLDICLTALDYAPLLGNGKGFMWEEVKPDNPMLLGAESVWFGQMVDYGIVGCINYLLVTLGCVYFLWKRSFKLIFFPLAFLVGKTLSIVIGIEQNFLILFSFLLYYVDKYYSKPNKDLITTTCNE